MPVNLSTRERQLLRMASNGLGDKEIALQLAISTGTVRTYWDRVRQKLDARNRTHVVCLAIGLGLITAPEALPRVPTELKGEAAIHADVKPK